jgi:hypothetical protein
VLQELLVLQRVCCAGAGVCAGVLVKGIVIVCVLLLLSGTQLAGEALQEPCGLAKQRLQKGLGL